MLSEKNAETEPEKRRNEMRKKQRCLPCADRSERADIFSLKVFNVLLITGYRFSIGERREAFVGPAPLILPFRFRIGSLIRLEAATIFHACSRSFSTTRCAFSIHRDPKFVTRSNPGRLYGPK